MRVIPILLLTLVFGVAFGNYLVASNGTAGTILKRAAATVMTTSAPSTLKDASSNNPKDAVIAPNASAANLGAGPVHLAGSAVGSVAVTCVHRNDGATVCGPVVEDVKKLGANPFEQPIAGQATPAVSVVKPPNPPAGAAKVVQKQASHEALLTPKQVPTPPIPRKIKPHALAQSARVDTRHVQFAQGAPPAPWADRKLADSEEPRGTPSHYSRSQSPPASLRQPPYASPDARDFPPPNRRPPTSVGHERPAGATRYDPRHEAPFMFEGQSHPRSSSSNRIPPINDGRAPMLPGWRRMPGNYEAERGAPPSSDRGLPPRKAADHYPPRNERGRLVRSATGDVKYAYGTGSTSRPDRARDAQLTTFDRRASDLEKQLRALRVEYAEALRRFRNRADARTSALPARGDNSAGNYD